MDYLTELSRLVDRERRVLESLSNNGCNPQVVAVQRQRFAQICEQYENLKDYYALNVDHGATV